MKKKILNTKRKFLTNENSEEGNQGELNTFSGYAHKSENIAKKKKRELESEGEMNLIHQEIQGVYQY